MTHDVVLETNTMRTKPFVCRSPHFFVRLVHALYMNEVYTADMAACCRCILVHAFNILLGMSTLHGICEIDLLTASCAIPNYLFLSSVSDSNTF